MTRFNIVLICNFDGEHGSSLVTSDELYGIIKEANNGQRWMDVISPGHGSDGYGIMIGPRHTDKRDD